MSSKFDYLLDKIAKAPFDAAPFRHVEIMDFLSPEHFDAIVTDPQVAFDPARSTEELLDTLVDKGYVFLHFPGCVSSVREYLDFLSGKVDRNWHKATEGFGIVYRLMDSRSEIINDLDTFFRSDRLRDLLMDKFGIENEVSVDAGLQKYLDGYEISPHPDIRRKALTWMLNINPGADTETAEFHTHYLRLKDQWSFIYDFWKHNPGYDRDWLPWGWCETVKRQRVNNSVVFFSPSDETIHAVKARYDHLGTQRTQMYGNLWYDKQSLPKAGYEQFDIPARVDAGAMADARGVNQRLREAAGAVAAKIKGITRKSEPGGYRAVEF